MAEKLTDQGALTQIASGDLLHIVDVSDTTDDAAGSSKKITVANLIPEGTSFPGSPYTGQRYFRTDLNYLCTYDGTQWVTVNDYVVAHLSQTVSADGYIDTGYWVGNNYAIYTERYAARTNVATTNDGSNYWTVTYRSVALDGSITAWGSFDTSGDTADTNTDHDGAASDTTPANYGNLWVYATKTGSPGNLTIRTSDYYRLIIT